MVDHRALGRARTLREFDDIVTAPVHGFADATEYYARSSSIRFLETVGVPTLLLCAANDPFVNADVLRQVRNIADRNSFLECVFPERGGHVGFVSGVVPWRARYWMEDYTLDWLAARSGPK
jgi:predicted alpha/beta-fold hydrolase